MGGNRGGTTTTSFLFDFVVVVPSSPDDGDFLFLFPAAAAVVGASLEAPPAEVDGVDEEVSVILRRDFVTMVEFISYVCFFGGVSSFDFRILIIRR
jgi:hypothetical protein